MLFPKRRAHQPRAASTADGENVPILFFDGHCGLCNRFVDFLYLRDRRGLFRFAPLQGKTATLYVPLDAVPEGGPGERALAPRSIVLWENGRIRRKSDAVLSVLAELGGAWRMASILRILPRFLRDALYDFVARNRYRWFGRRAACRLPTPGERVRFLP
jgi:predicted DCC family thiol-disulfide oxidoreductase YuxK